MKILNDGQTLLATQYYLAYKAGLVQYNLSLTDFKEVGMVILDIGVELLQVSKSADVVVGWTLNRAQPVVYQLVKQEIFKRLEVG